MMLYLGCPHDVPLEQGAEFAVEAVPPAGAAVRGAFPVPHVYFLGAHTGCSCGFPCVKGEQPVEYFDGIFDGTSPVDREKDLRSAAALLRLLTDHVTPASPVYLYPVWNGEESAPPLGNVTWVLGELVVEKLVLNERFMHEIVAGAPADR